MAVLVTGNEIVLTGTVGDLYWDDSFSAADVILALARVGRGQDVTVRLNSGGGIATEGAAIHAALSAHTGRKTIIVEGIAASAASVIAMAGDEIVMAMGAIMMIHDPSGFTFGTISEHELQIKALTALATAMAGIYADKSGRTPEEARADMQGELWMSPAEAVAAGYADRVQGRAVVLVSTARENRVGMQDTTLRLLTKARKNGEILKIFADGVPRPATNAEAEKAINAASDRIQSAFDYEQIVVADLVAGSLTTREGVDAAFADLASGE